MDKTVGCLCDERTLSRVLRDFFLLKVFSANWANELRDPCTSLLSRFSQDSDCFFLSLNGITLACGGGGGGGGGSDFRLITLEMALCGFYTDLAPSVSARPSADSTRGGL